MKIDTLVIFLGIFIVLVILSFFYKWMIKRKDISSNDLTTEIEDFNLSIEKPSPLQKEDVIVGELDLIIRGKEISTTKITDQEIIIGRDPGQSNLIISEPTVSKIHCMLYSKENKIYIKDNESTNGTFVNNKRITETEVKSNDVIFLGKKGIINLTFRAKVEKPE